MSVELITRRSMPDAWQEFEEYPRDWCPQWIEERDMTRSFAQDGRQVERLRRTRVVAYLTHDQELAVKPFDVGPPTGEQASHIQCVGVTELSQIFELLDLAKRIDQKHADREKWVKPLRTAAFLEGLAQADDERIKQLTKQSTIGPAGMIQRS